MPERTPSPFMLQAEFRRWMMDERGWSPETRRTRISTVKAAEAHVQQTFGRRLIRAQRGHIISFLSLAAHPRSRNRSLGDLKAFFRFARDRGYRKNDPTSGIERVREPRNLPRPLTHAQAVKLLRAASSVSHRAHTIVTLLLYAGLRRQEASWLTWSDIDLEGRRLRAFGKGSKERVVPVADSLAVVLWAWKLRPGAGVNYVFPSAWNHKGGHISPITLWKDVRDAADEAGIKGVSPHRLRHTFATEALRRGTDVRHVQALLGHENLNSTQIYTKVEPVDLDQAVARLDFGT